MTGAVIGLGAGIGLLLILLGLMAPRAQRQSHTSWLRRTIDRAGLERVGPSAIVGACVSLAALSGLLVVAISGVLILGLLAAVVFGYLPLAVLRRKARTRGIALRSAWPDAVDMLGSAVRAGMSLPEAVIDLGVRGPEALRPAFRSFAADYRASGSFALALDGLKQSLGDPVADRVIVSLGIAREVGGSDLGRVLGTLSDFLRQDARARGEIEARQSWTVNAARVAVAAPWITLLLLCTRPETVAAYSTAMGAIIILGSAALSVVAYRVMTAIGKLPDEPRVLA
ncbi:MAG: type II secretion system F family protein [Candidatus Nanopelagicales bacterium]|jgi:tight adherence protein B